MSQQTMSLCFRSNNSHYIPVQICWSMIRSRRHQRATVVPDQDSTYVNHIIDGAYEIRLTDITQREFGISWGSIEGAQFKNYILEADVSLLEDNLTDAQYGIWFHYQDDFNFIYFGLSNQGEYRVAVVKDNSTQRTIQDWTPHPAIRPGAATNTLTIEAWSDGMITLSVNGEQPRRSPIHLRDWLGRLFLPLKNRSPLCHLTRLQIGADAHDFTAGVILPAAALFHLTDYLSQPTPPAPPL
jgi:hypothetical protein